jgi:hypothetical protein
MEEGLTEDRIRMKGNGGWQLVDGAWEMEDGFRRNHTRRLPSSTLDPEEHRAGEHKGRERGRASAKRTEDSMGIERG